MFLKFGFGRGSHEATGEIRSGRMRREDAVGFAKEYDNYDCADFWDKLCDLYRVTPIMLENIVETHANKSLVERVGYWERLDRRWQLKPELQNYSRFIEDGVEVGYDGTY